MPFICIKPGYAASKGFLTRTSFLYILKISVFLGGFLNIQTQTKKRRKRKVRTSLSPAPYGIAGGPARRDAPPGCPSGLKMWEISLVICFDHTVDVSNRLFVWSLTPGWWKWPWAAVWHRGGQHQGRATSNCSHTHERRDLSLSV